MSTQLDNALVPDVEKLDELLNGLRWVQRQRAKEATKRGYVFDPIVGYVPWGIDGPALENESKN